MFLVQFYFCNYFQSTCFFLFFFPPLFPSYLFFHLFLFTLLLTLPLHPPVFIYLLPFLVPPFFIFTDLPSLLNPPGWPVHPPPHYSSRFSFSLYFPSYSCSYLPLLPHVSLPPFPFTSLPLPPFSLLLVPPLFIFFKFLLAPRQPLFLFTDSFIYFKYCWLLATSPSFASFHFYLSPQNLVRFCAPHSPTLLIPLHNYCFYADLFI